MAYPEEIRNLVDRLIEDNPGIKVSALMDELIARGVRVSTSFLYRRYDAVVAKRAVTKPAVTKLVTPLWRVDPETIPDEDKIIGVFSDLHIPAVIDGYLDFVINTFIEQGVNTIVCTGDMFDFHAASRWPSEPDLPGNRYEMELVKKHAKPWFDAFPYAVFMEGNHDRIPARMAKSCGMDTWFLDDYYKKLGMPDTWERHGAYHMVAGVEFDHGEGSGGMYGCINTARKRGGSFVQGHLHSYGGVIHRANSRKIYFGANAGCGCDNTHPAMRYSKKNPEKGTVGCLVINSPIDAHFIPMPLGERK